MQYEQPLTDLGEVGVLIDDNGNDLTITGIRTIR